MPADIVLSALDDGGNLLSEEDRQTLLREMGGLRDLIQESLANELLPADKERRSRSMRTSDTGSPIGAPSGREIPRMLDQVIQANRESAQLRLATDADIGPLLQVIPHTDALDGATSDWRFIAFARVSEGQSVTHVHALGDNARRGVGVKVTSPIVAYDPAQRIDLSAGRESWGWGADAAPSAAGLRGVVGLGLGRGARRAVCVQRLMRP